MSETTPKSAPANQLLTTGRPPSMIALRDGVLHCAAAPSRTRTRLNECHTVANLDHT
ncbi:hypothetical protein GCM10020229_47190 [Kitasatospora albolonga]